MGTLSKANGFTINLTFIFFYIMFLNKNNMSNNNNYVVLYIECDNRYPQSIDVFNIILNKFINNNDINDSIRNTLKKWTEVKSKYRNNWILYHDLDNNDLRQLKTMIFNQLRTFYIEDIIQYGSIK